MSNQFEVEEVKRAANGQWVSILAEAGLPTELLDGRGQPCPKCGGTDRFSAFRDTEETGGVMCRQCFSERNGDGLSTIQWLTGWSFPESLQFVAEQVGVQPTAGVTTCREVDIVATVARAKRMPVEVLRQFGAESTKRRGKPVARVPVYNEDGQQHSYFDLTPDGKGLFRKGKGSAGVFLPGQLPKRGETRLLVEGCKDAAAFVGLGFKAAGLPRNEMEAKYAQLFEGCDVIIAPDLDSAGMTGAQKTGGRLKWIAASVRIARLPGEVVKSGGQDVLAKDGEQAVRTAIEAAIPWEPSSSDADDDRPEVLITFDEAEVATEVLKHLGGLTCPISSPVSDGAERPAIFEHCGKLVHIVNERSPENSLDDSVPQIQPLEKPIIRERITQAVRLVEETNSKDGTILVPKRPPDWLTQSIQKRGNYKYIRRLEGITGAATRWQCDSEAWLRRAVRNPVSTELCFSGDL